jgi:hypothetical protein
MLGRTRVSTARPLLGATVAAIVAGCGASPTEPFWVGEFISYGKTIDAEVCGGSWAIQDRHVGELAELIDADITAPIPYTLIGLDDREHFCGQEDVAGCAVEGEAAYSIHRIHMHELAHVVLRHAGVRGPHAFNEGLAEVFGDGLIYTPRRLPIADVVADIEADRGGGYWTAGLFVRFLIEEHGLETLLEFMRRTDRETAPDDYADAFLEVFGTPLEEAYVAFDDYPSCSTLNNRIALTDCTGDAVPWVDGTWSVTSELACDDPEVFGPSSDGDKELIASSRGLMIDEAGSYRIEVAGSVGGLAGARVNRCGSCWDAFDARVQVGQTDTLELEAGRYYVTLVRELAEAGDVRVTLTAP